MSLAEVKWIKLATGLPDNKKIKQIRKLPGGDTVALMWVFLMCLAGETNEDGMVYFTPEIPYTEEMLADQFSMDINTVKLGLATFQRFGMIQIIDDIICLSSWEKWQAVDGLATIREQTRKRVAKHREKQKLMASNVTSNVTVTQCNATDIDIEKEREEEKEELSKDNSNKKPTKHKYGEYSNVLLSDQDMEKLKSEFPDWQARIERLSSYMASTGKSYKNHLATIRNWARKDAEKLPKSSYKQGRTEVVPAWMDKPIEDDLDATERRYVKPEVQARADALKERLGC